MPEFNQQLWSRVSQKKQAKRQEAMKQISEMGVYFEPVQQFGEEEDT